VREARRDGGTEGERERERGSAREGKRRQEATDLKNGATKPTEGTDPLSERLSNSTRARFAREPASGRRRVEFTAGRRRIRFLR
jgi:hypothetical protein